MEISVFDERKRVVTIGCEDIEHIKRVGGRLCYKTCNGLYYGSNTLEEESILRFERDFRLIDKNSLINMGKVTKIENGVAYISATKYPISRRRIAGILKIWDKTQNNDR